VNRQRLATLAGIGLVIAYLVKRYTSDPVINLGPSGGGSLAVAEPADPSPVFTLPTGTVKEKAPVTFPYESGVVAVAPTTVFPSAPQPVFAPSTVEDYDAIWRSEQPESAALV
jgi:hypothetical protein